MKFTRTSCKLETTCSRYEWFWLLYGKMISRRYLRRPLRKSRVATDSSNSFRFSCKIDTLPKILIFSECLHYFPRSVLMPEFISWKWALTIYLKNSVLLGYKSINGFKVCTLKSQTKEWECNKARMVHSSITETLLPPLMKLLYVTGFET